MAHAAVLGNHALGSCDGSRPWLGAFTRETCGEPSRLLIRSASNAYFPQLMSVISLPERDASPRRIDGSTDRRIDGSNRVDGIRFAARSSAGREPTPGLCRQRQCEPRPHGITYTCRTNSPRSMTPVKREEFLKAVAHGSAAAWEHVNLLGEYDLSEDKFKDSVGIKPPKLTD